MSKKVDCPKCKGSGSITKYPDDVDKHFRRITKPWNVPCDACKGKGWVEKKGNSCLSTIVIIILVILFLAAVYAASGGG